MTKLSTNLSQQPANLTEMTREDRVTYRKWAYGWFIAYSILLGAMVIFSVATRPAPHTTQASRTIGAEPLMNSTASIRVSGRTERRR
jgi:hypothetical protein